MGVQHPYLQLRGSRFFFRIGVPLALRHLVGARELTTALLTGERASAIPLALELGATAHRLFHDLRHSVMSSDDLKKALADDRVKLKIDRAREEIEQQVDEAHQIRIAAVQRLQQEQSAERREWEARVETLKDALQAALSARAPRTPPVATTGRQEALQAPLTPQATQTLRQVVDEFLADYPKERKAKMFAKHEAALPWSGRRRGHERLSQAGGSRIS